MARRVSSAARVFNADPPRTVEGLARLAELDETAAKEVMQQMADNLLRVGNRAGASLFETALASPYLPEGVREMKGTGQSKNLATLVEKAHAQSGADPLSNQPIPLQYVTGRVTVENERCFLTTPGGRVLVLAEEYGRVPVNVTSMLGAIKDGPISLQGTMGRDGRTFNVEGFAPNKNGNFDRFTYARSAVTEKGDVYLGTPRGAVKVTHPEMIKMCKAVPDLALIFPGEPVKTQDGWEYPHNPSEYFGLARLMNNSIQAPNSNVPGPWIVVDMALSNYAEKPMLLPEGTAKLRIKEGDRFWALGAFVLNDKGEPQRFEASDVGGPERGAASMESPVASANRHAAAILTVDAGDGIVGPSFGTFEGTVRTRHSADY